MAGPLGVSHLLLFSKSSTGNTNLRVALTPRGPTLHFRVERYSLCKDVQKALKRPKGGGKEYLTAPLLVMNNFASPSQGTRSDQAIPKHLEDLTTTIFQSLFPPISPQTAPLSSIRRVLLLNREIPKINPSSETSEQAGFVFNLRHYAITTKRTGLSAGIRKINAAEKMLKERKGRRGIPDLGRLDDVADYLLNPTAEGYTSGSESEIETDVEVEVLLTDPQKVTKTSQAGLGQQHKDKNSGRKEQSVQKKAVKLVEIGPRMKLRMTKVEEGLCGGKVMWHQHLRKSNQEVEEMDRVWKERKDKKEERKNIQKANVQKKRKGSKIEGAEVVNDHSDLDQGEFDSEDVAADI